MAAPWSDWCDYWYLYIVEHKTRTRIRSSPALLGPAVTQHCPPRQLCHRWLCDWRDKCTVGQRLSRGCFANSRNGVGGGEFFHIYLRYSSVETLCMMFIAHLSIINGFIELKTSENDYVRTLHEGTTQGLRVCCQLQCLVQVSQLRIYVPVSSFL